MIFLMPLQFFQYLNFTKTKQNIHSLTGPRLNKKINILPNILYNIVYNNNLRNMFSGVPEVYTYYFFGNTLIKQQKRTKRQTNKINTLTSINRLFTSNYYLALYQVLHVQITHEIYLRFKALA